MVWSDQEVKRLSKEFITVADEAYYLYPENPAHREQAKNREDFQFFKKFGEAMPPGTWNPGTKQGIYMMGPNAEYLEGRFAASGEPSDIRARLTRALDRWNQLRKDKGYANQPIPVKPWAPPPDVEGELILRVNVRDLPRGPGDRSGARRHELQTTGMWMDFTRWAWNENWVGVAKISSFVPKGNSWESIDSQVVRALACEALVDIVRGQAQEWKDPDVKSAELKMRRISATKFEYSGSASLANGGRGFDAKLYGQGTWSAAKSKFDSLDIVAMGVRRGASRFNMREQDPGPAPMGVTLSLSRK